MAAHILSKLHKPVIEREIIRMLWTMHFASTDQLCRLIYGTTTRHRLRLLSNALQRMHTLNWIWREPVRISPGYRGHIHGFNSGGWFYGLMEIGRATALDHFKLYELQAIHCMTREAYFSGAARSSIIHSTHYTEFLTRFIEETRRSPFSLGIYIDTECTLLGRHLRMDGLLRYRRYRQEPPRVMERKAHIATLPPWSVPWQHSLRLPASAEVLDRTYAIEIDESTEQLSIIQRKAENYKRTFLGGMELVDDQGRPLYTPVAWDAVLCPDGEQLPPSVRKLYFPIPVFVVGSLARLRSLWGAWQRGWPKSAMRVTTWELLDAAASVINAPYVNHHGQWVDLLGFPHQRAQVLPTPPQHDIGMSESS